MTLKPRAWAAVCGLLLAFSIREAFAAPALQEFASTDVKTMSANSEITTENQPELRKIPGDIALAYRLHRGAMKYIQPGMLRVETSIPLLGSGYYVVNGNRTLTVAPFVHKVRDVSDAPGKKQTLLDFGLVPPELFNDYDAAFERHDGTYLVYNVTPKQKSETYRYEIWIDPKTKITVRRLDYDRHGVLTKSESYINPIQAAPGIYVPSAVQLYNSQNKLAGVTVYQNVKVNQPLNPSLFNI